MDLLSSQREHSASSSGEVLVGLVVLLRDDRVHGFERFGSSLNRNDGSFLLPSSLRDDGYSRHSLESRGELESTLDVDLGLVEGLYVVLGGNDVA